MATVTLEQISSANLAMKKVAKLDPYPNGLERKYQEAVEGMNDCAYQRPSVIPEDMATDEFSQETECIMGDIAKNKHFDMLHELININSKPLKVDQRVGTVVMSGSYPETDHDLFVIKAQSYKDLWTEFIAGYYCLNVMRHMIPNFSLVYGLFNCSLPVADKTSVGSWCWNGQGSGYIVYEKIQGPPLEQFLPTASVESVIKSIMQTFYSIHMAYKRYDFTHYDLHTNNVVIHKIPEKRRIEYQIPGGSVYMDVDAIACIIDYGLCHIEYRGLNVGKNNYEHASIFYNKANPVYDYYRLLTASIELAAYCKRQDIVDALSPMYRYIITGPIDKIGTLERVGYLPKTLWNMVIDDETFIIRMTRDYDKYLTTSKVTQTINYNSIPYTFPTYDQATYSYKVVSALDNIYDLQYPSTFRDAETCQEFIMILQDETLTTAYFRRLVELSHIIATFKEALHYTKYITVTPQLKRSILYASRKLSTVMNVVRDDCNKLILVKHIFPNSIDEVVTKNIQRILVPFTGL